MFRPKSPFSFFHHRKNKPVPFKDYYHQWLTTLSTTHLPHLQSALSSFSTTPTLLSTHVDTLHHHLQSYYTALDSAASSSVSSVLYPPWRNSVEIPFLWLGDLHPYLFTNLLRSFLEQNSSDSSSDNAEFGPQLDCVRPWVVETAWRSPDRALIARVEQIECGLRLMVPALAARARDAQARMMGRLGVGTVEEAVEKEMEEMVAVVSDANRLRSSVLADVLSVASVYQGALFLEALAKFLVGFRDEKLVKEFEKCRMVVNSS